MHKGGGSYKAGGVHFLPSDQAGDVVSVVDDALHAAHKVVAAPRAGLVGGGQAPEGDLHQIKRRSQLGT